MIRRFLDGLYLWAGYAAGAFLIVIFLLMMALSLGRQVGLNIPSGDDFAAWAMAALAFLSLAYTFKSGEIIRIGLVHRPASRGGAAARSRSRASSSARRSSASSPGRRRG